VDRAMLADAQDSYRQALERRPADLGALRGAADTSTALNGWRVSTDAYLEIVRRVTDHPRMDPMLLSYSGWSHLCLGKADAAVRLLVNSQAGHRDLSVQLDLAVAKLLSGRRTSAWNEYERWKQQVANVHILRRRGLVAVALNDLHFLSAVHPRHKAWSELPRVVGWLRAVAEGREVEETASADTPELPG
jgi:hypothetical protein